MVMSQVDWLVHSRETYYMLQDSQPKITINQFIKGLLEGGKSSEVYKALSDKQNYIESKYKDEPDLSLREFI